MCKKLIASIVVAFWLINVQAQTISGYVRNKDKNPLPFVSVFIKNTSWSCSSNENGYYVLKVPRPGTYEVIYRIIGYKQQIVKLSVTKDIKHNVTLDESTLELKGVVISAKDEDPAYRIIREAIKKKSYYLENPACFKCNVYNKNLAKAELPEKIMGFKRSELLENDNDILDSAGKGVIYFSESFTELYRQKPDKIKEIMISSKVSGDKSSYSFNTASMMLFNLYENNISGFSQRGIISPLSNSAFFYYKFKLEGTFMENGLLVNKIKIIPKRQNDPVFRGHIYIVENEWNIYSTDVYLIRDAQIEFFDTLSIKQQYTKVDSVNWMPISNVYDYRIRLFGVAIYGYFTGFQSDYVINPDLPKNFFNNEVSAIKDSANIKDTTYWNQVRPVPLTPEEQKDYRKKDSLEIKYDSKEYKDSVNNKSNRFKFGDVIYTDYTYRRASKGWSFTIFSLAKGLEFNTVEGISLTSSLEYYQNRHNYSVMASIRYGFSNGRLNGVLSFIKPLSLLNLSSFRVSAGKYIYQFNNSKPISSAVNGFYTLFLQENYAKYYENIFVRAYYKRELINGIYFNGGFSVEYRNALYNSTTYTFNKNNHKEYTSNDPRFPYLENTGFPSHLMGSVDVGFVFRIKQKYSTQPGIKTVIGSKYPEFSINYKKGLGDVDFDFVKLGINQSVNMNLLGTFKYMIEYGVFYNNRRMYFVDYHHSNGNQTIFLKKEGGLFGNNDEIVIGGGGSGQNITGYNLLPYYQFSTNDYFIEVHAEQHFGGFFLNKIPLIRKLRLHEVVGIHYLQNNLIDNYFEADFGLEHIGIPKLKFPLYFRVDWVFGFTPETNLTNGFRIGLGF